MLKTFRTGGVHPPGNKWTANQGIIKAEIPAKVIIPLSQHIGTPATAIVKKGDPVKVGTLIARSGGFVSAPVHSSVSGTVDQIGEITDASDIARPAVYINVAGDEWEETIDCSETLVTACTLSGKEIIEKISKAGIVGLGGATFPTHIKLSPPPGNKAELLIVNAAECEPYLTADHSLMLAKGEQILTGTTILMKALQVNRAVIGIENNKPDAINHLTKLSATYDHIEIIPLIAKYPQGSEKILIDAVMRRQVKSGALPVSVGAVVQNVGTVYAIYEAVQKNKPLIERVVTVSGKAIAKPSNLLVRIGTPVRELIRMTCGPPEITGKVIFGGPMMGKALVNTDVPVTKGCTGIIVMSKAETVRKPVQNCFRCARCIRVCPMGLNPTLLMRATEFYQWDLAESAFISDCIECGSCSYSCPAHQPLLDYIRMGKSKVMNIVRTRKAKAR